MKLNEQLLTLRHLLLYFCTLGLSWLMAGIVPSLLVSLLVFLVISISSLCDEKHENLRYLPLLLWLCLFLPVFSDAGILSKVLPVIYTAARIHARIRTMTYDQSRTELLLGLALYGVVALFSSLENASAFFSLTLPCFLSWLALSTFMLRMLKNPAVLEDRQYLLYSSGISLGMAAVILLMLSDTFADMLNTVITFIYRNLLLTPVLWLLKGFTWLLKAVYDLFAGFSAGASQAENPFEGIFEEIGSYNEHYEFIYTQGGDTTWLMVLVRVLAVLIVVLIAWMIIRRMRKRQTREESGLSFTKESTRQNPRSRHSLNPSSRIRNLYRKYLKLADEWQLIENKSEASDRIAAKTDSLLHSDDASRLRDLWLPVRYGEENDDNVQEAEKLYRSIKKQFREL